MSKRVQIILGVGTGILGLILGIYLVATFFVPKTFVPPAFSQSRIAGAGFAKRIVELLGDSVQNLQKIGELDRQGDTAQALTLISEQVVKNQEVQQEAIKLSSELQTMAQAIPEIEPSQARFTATEVASDEIALVTHLVNYTNQLRDLFDVLRSKFSSHVSDSGRVQQLLDSINVEAKAINDLNVKLNDSLAQFDALILPSVKR